MVVPLTETQFPSHPNISTIMLEIEEDFRPGFAGHGIIDIAWEKPAG